MESSPLFGKSPERFTKSERLHACSVGPLDLKSRVQRDGHRASARRSDSDKVKTTIYSIILSRWRSVKFTFKDKDLGQG